MKKFLLTLTSLFIIALMMLSLASCDDLSAIFGGNSENSETEPPSTHKHTFDKSWSRDDTHHWHAANCDDNESCKTARSRYEEHTFKNGSCTACYATRTHTHVYDNDCDEYCNSCYAQRKVIHVYDNDCDTSCNKCSGTRAVTHTPGEDDGDCTTPIYCSICEEMTIVGSIGHAFTTACDTTCNNDNCIHRRSIEHVYTNACDTTCNECNYKRSAPHLYNGGNICETCGYGSIDNPKDLKVPGTLTFNYVPEESAEPVWYNFLSAGAVKIVVTLGENTVMGYGANKENLAYNTESSVEFTLTANTLYYVTFATDDYSAGEISATVKCYDIYTSSELPLYGKEIINFGDSIYGNNNSSTSVSSYLQFFSGAKTYNCAFGGTRAHPRQENPGHVNEPYRHFDMKNLVDAIISRNFEAQDAALTLDNSGNAFNNRFIPMMETIKGLKIDDQIITLNHGTNDWTGGTSIENYKATMKYIINRLRENYVNVRIVLVSPTWRFSFDDEGNVVPGSGSADNGNGRNVDFVNAMREVAKECGVDFIDCYNIGIDESNCLNYFSGTDATHHDARGREYLAKHVANELAKIID